MSDEEEKALEIPDPDPNPDSALSPRHRKLAELLAQGHSNNDICRILGYSQSRVSILKHNPRIQEKVRQLQDRAFEISVGDRLKGMNESALNVLESALNDKTKRVKEKDKIEIAKWTVEMNAGKATQKHEVLGGNLIEVIDRLDAMKQARPISIPGAIEVSFEPVPVKEIPRPPDAPEMTPEEKEEAALLRKWAEEY